MTEDQTVEALLDIIDSERAENRDLSAQLTVLGLAERVGKAEFRPTRAGWNLLGEKGRKHRYA